MYSTTLDLILSLSLIILLIATIMALFFTSLLSCLRRRNNSPDLPTQPSSAANGIGDLLAGFPVIIYESSPQLSPTQSPKSPPDCSICLEEFGRGEEVRVLPKCSHMFHRLCIDQWMPMRSLQCPVCRDRVIDDGDAEGNGEGVRRMECRNNNRNNGNVSPAASLAFAFGYTSSVPPALNL